MKASALWRVSVTTTPEAEDAVAELLGTLLERPVSTFFNLESGASVVTAYLSQKPRSWPALRQRVAAGLQTMVRCGLRPGSDRIALTRLRRENWAESWKRHFPPFEIGGRLLVKPSWLRRRARRDQAVVVLDPGLSFGTGRHPTTRFCLEELVRCGKIAAGRSFLDIGTGSGILALAAAKLGFQPVDAFDFDPESVRVSRANARANRVQTKIRIRRGDAARLPIRPARRYDLVCANLISPLLISECRRVAAQVAPGGRLVLAGILKREFIAVQKAYSKTGLKLASAKTGNEWRSGSFWFPRRKSSGKFE